MNNIDETIRRLENIAGHAVHYAGEPPFIMSLDDGHAVHEAIDLMKKQDAKEVEIHETDEWYCPVFACPDCKAKWMSDEENTHYCPNCGRAVKMNA